MPIGTGKDPRPKKEADATGSNPALNLENWLPVIDDEN
jgi:hypothetical protein